MDDEIVEMQRKIEDLGGRISQREQELRQRGVFSNVHAAYVGSLKDAYSRLASRVAEAPRQHWLGIKDELDRDYNSLVDELGRLTEGLDTAQMKAPQKAPRR